jgi:hypothetical protein
MKYFQAILTLFGIISLNACSNLERYQEPERVPNTTIIKINNEPLLSLHSLIGKPSNRIYFESIDGKSPPVTSGDSLRVSPGKHIIVVRCKTDGYLFDKKTLIINAQLGKSYTISYPEYMRGFHTDYTACQKLRVNNL